MPEFGWDPVVLAPRDGAYYRDPELSFPEDRVVRTRSLELSRTGKRVFRVGGDDVRRAEVRGARAALRRAARAILYQPDAQVGWYMPAVLAGRRELRRRPVDAILSSSFPITAHLVARRLRASSRTPWVADFRDPWSELMPPGRGRRRAARLERSLARSASAVTMTSPSWAERHAALWDRSVEVVPNGHDLAASPPPDPPDEFVVSYLGSYYPQWQDLSAVLRAIRQLAENHGRTRPAVDRLRFIGTLHPALREQLAAMGLETLVEETGFVSNRKAMSYLNRSSALLIAGPSDARGILTGQVAAKIPECLATGLPIVYVGDPDCDAARLLRREPGCHVLATHDADGVVQALAAAKGRTYEREPNALSRRTFTGRLAQALDGVVRAAAKSGPSTA